MINAKKKKKLGGEIAEFKIMEKSHLVLSPSTE